MMNKKAVAMLCMGTMVLMGCQTALPASKAVQAQAQQEVVKPDPIKAANTDILKLEAERLQGVMAERKLRNIRDVEYFNKITAELKAREAQGAPKK